MLKIHTGEVEPTNPSLQTSLEDYRAAVNAHMLDGDTPFYDRVRALFATQTGQQGKFEANPTVVRLQRAQSEIIRVGYITGVLDADEPYSVVACEGHDETARLTGIAINLNFAVARTLSDTDRYWHESFGQGSWRTQSLPVVHKPVSNTVTLARTDVGVGMGSENIAQQLNDRVEGIVVGDLQIMESFAGRPLLQTAFLRAANAMSIELIMASEAVKLNTA